MDGPRLTAIRPSGLSWLQRSGPGWLAFLSLLSACPGDSGPGSEDESGDGTDATDPDEEGADSEAGSADDDGGYQACHDAFMRGSALVGQPCTRNEHCDSLVCEGFETNFAPDSGTCAETPPACRTRVMGTARDLLTGEPLAQADVALLAAAEAAGGVLKADPLLTATADEVGRFDVMTDQAIDAFVAVIGTVTIDGYARSTTGLAIPIDNERNYEPCFALREWWAVAHDDLATWSAGLQSDTDLAPHLPLEEAWVVVGLMITMEYPVVRVSGGSLVPANPEGSEAVIRYLNDDGATFNDQESGSTGVFIIVGAGPGEQFDARAPGLEPFRYEWIRTGTFPDSVFAFTVHMVPSAPSE